LHRGLVSIREAYRSVKLQSIKEIFLEKIKNPDFLKPYQKQSAWYFELPEEKNTIDTSLLEKGFHAIISNVENGLFSNSISKTPVTLDAPKDNMSNRPGLN